MRVQKIFLGYLYFFCLVGAAQAAAIKPIRALLVTGGCCHDYKNQKTILTEGISARANVVWSIVHEGDGTTDHKISIYNDPDWAKNFDVVVHDECFSDVKDAAFVRGILKPHRNGLPAANLHCAMHSYRVDFDQFKEWFEFTGIDSRAQGPHVPLDVIVRTNKHPVLEGVTNWTTGNEELYNALEIWPTVTPLIDGQQGNDKHLVAWLNKYRGTRVFSTTLGHNSATVADSRYLDLVTRGLLWSVNKLNKDYLKPADVKRKVKKMVRVPINLALKKTTSASASQEGHAPESAVDGDLDSRWCAPDGGNNYWWQVDLGKPEEIVGARISWEHEGVAYQYRIDGSVDGKTWKTLVEEKAAPRPQVDEQKFSANEIRHVRIIVTQAAPNGWASFFEFEVLGKELVEKVVLDASDLRLASVQSPAGFEQTIFAAPPSISYPTCLEATPWGDVFVGVDQNGSLDREKDRGWVVRCRDTDADGAADNFTTFAKMDSPRGLVFDNNTLYVMHPPFLSAFTDDNGDGVADRSEVLVRGLGNDLNFRGADHTCNGVRLGIDGWLYISLGDYGALNAVAKDGSRVQVHGGGIVRVRPNGSDLEVFAQGTRNTYDVAIDPFMNLFTCDNTNDGDEWNLRLSHMIDTANYGYPSLFKNFPDEIMRTMKDFGGGSPTGALFLDEPGFPDEFGRGLYTCQWGWNNVTRHPLKKSGATFTAEKETFIRVPRPTGIAADGLGNIYVASWKGATFNFADPNAGFVVRVSPLNNQAAPFPNLQKLSDKKLLGLLASPSATRRLHVKREILRRQPRFNFINALSELASSSRDLPIRAAAIFTLGQIENPAASKALVKLSNDTALREFALRALADSKTRAEKHPSEIFIKALADKNSAVRLQAILALNRLQRTETAENIFPFVIAADPAIAHAAFRALVSFRAADVCFKALDQSDSAAARGALRILGNLHETGVVDGLIERLENHEQMRPEILETLCRLYHREAEWDGSWWTTRPDISGPYYKPVAWECTKKITAVLRNELTKDDPQNTHLLLTLFKKYKIESPGKDSSSLQQPKITFLPNETQPDQWVAPLSENSIAKIPYEEVIKRVTTASGDAKIGAKLFETVGCVKCHATKKDETPKGPFLGDIAARYNNAEILESILRPSAKIAQGFETTTFENKDGDSFDGFVVRESGDEVELRNIVGATIIPKKYIVVRGTRTTSIMPDGLVDALSPEDLASMLSYLQSLKPKS